MKMKFKLIIEDVPYPYTTESGHPEVIISFIETYKGTLIKEDKCPIILTRTAITNEYIHLVANYIACMKHHKEHKGPRKYKLIRI